MTDANRNWQSLCEAASKEPDSDRLMALVWELIEALDERKGLAPDTRGLGGSSFSSGSCR